MKLDLKEPIGGGGFGEVWKAVDDLDRLVAAKILRPERVGSADAIAHGKALAKVDHPNVVKVYGVAEVDDPAAPGRMVPCVSMELLEGQTLKDRMAGPRLSPQEASRIGLAVVRGLDAIHRAGISHNDLHDQNIMLTPDGGAKIIDLFYLSNSRVTSSARGKLKQGDLDDLQSILKAIVLHSELDPGLITELSSLFASSPEMSVVEDTYLALTDQSERERKKRRVLDGVAMLRDRGFDESVDYARAVMEEMPGDIVCPVLVYMIREPYCEQHHIRFVNLAWKSLTDNQKEEVSSELSDALNTELPDGNWPPLLLLLAAMGKQGWNSLRPRASMRLEKLLISDVLRGHVNGYQASISLGGQLGTWAVNFWQHFAHREQFIANIGIMLRRDWFSQNYIGAHFMKILPKLPTTDEERDILVSGLRRAVVNDAKVLKNNLEKLTAEWRAEVLRDGEEV